jgi:hypothetical protein
MKVVINYEPAFAGMSAWLYEDRADGSRWVVNPTELEFTLLDHAVETPPTFRFDERGGMEFLQSFADALIKAGFKPDEIKAHDKEVTAIKNHLEDMRSLVFKGKSKS